MVSKRYLVLQLKMDQPFFSIPNLGRKLHI